MSHNFALLMERFPMLGLLAPSFPIESQEKQDFSSWDALSLECEVLYVYGVSLDAYLKLKSWLHQNGARRLVFLENREGALGAFLQGENAFHLLQDAQVGLHLVGSGRALDESLEALSQMHPVRELEVISLPSRKGSYFRSLRLKLLRKTTLTGAIQTDRANGYQLFFNFVRNACHAKDSFYVNALKNAFANIPAVICGAGPSLSEAFRALGTLESKALIFACGSAMAALSRANIEPHFCVAVDPNREEFLRAKNCFAFSSPLLYSTRVHPDVFSTVNGPFGYVRSQFSDVSQLWLEEELGLADPLLGAKLSSESISVTSMALAAAEHLGCNPIIFAGLDMAYTGNQRYSQAVGVRETAEEAKSARKAISDRVLIKKDRQGKKVYSAVRWVMESASLSAYAKAHPHVRFLSATQGGIGFKGIDYAPLEKIAADFHEEHDLRGMLHAASISAPMPKVPIEPKLLDLKESLLRVIDSLNILSGKTKGIPILAELEMKEELAFSVLFYDLFLLLPHWLKGKNPEDKWPLALSLAEKYLAVMPEKNR